MKLWAGWSGVRIPAVARVVLSSIQPPVQWVSDAVTPRQRQRGWLQSDVDHSMCPALRLRVNGAISPLPQVAFISWT